MHGFRTRILQDVPHMLPAKSLQTARSPSNISKLRFWSSVDFPRKGKFALESAEVSLSKTTARDDAGHIARTFLPAAAKKLGSQSTQRPSCLNANARLKDAAALKPVGLSSLLDEKLTLCNEVYPPGCEPLGNELVGDFDPLPRDRRREKRLGRAEDNPGRPEGCRKTSSCRAGGGKFRVGLDVVRRESLVAGRNARGARMSGITRRSYASCSKSGKKEPSDDSKKKCQKGPAECLPKKSTERSCAGSAKTDGGKKSREPPRKASACTYEKYCANRKARNGNEGSKQSGGESMKEKFERELKEISECKKRKPAKSEKKDDKCTKATAVAESEIADAIGLPRKQVMRGGLGSFARNLPSALNELISRSFACVAGAPPDVCSWSPIAARAVKALDVMFDRSLRAAKAYRQDDRDVKRAAADHNKTRSPPPYDVSNGDLIRGDELPLFIEIENNEEEEADERTDRSAEPIES